MLGTLPWLASILLLAGESAMGGQISDFELPDLHDQAVRLSDFRDQQFVVVIFLGTKCPLVTLYAPRLNELADQYASWQACGIWAYKWSSSAGAAGQSSF